MKHQNFFPAFILFLTTFLFVVILLPQSSYAAYINASAESSISAGDISIINIYLNTEGQEINSLEGTISLSDNRDSNFEVKDISLVNSVFSMWPRKPSLTTGHNITFIGGVPGGVKGDRLLIFSAFVKINSPGSFVISPRVITAYKNDGLATAISITKDISTINVSSAGSSQKNALEEVISNDNIAPDPFNVSLIKDPNLYDNKKFINFETNDGQSGISHYEVREGSYPAVRSGTSYILVDQNKKANVVVTAYDKAGNFQVVSFKEKQPIRWLTVFTSVIIILVINKIVKNKIKRRSNAKILQ